MSKKNKQAGKSMSVYLSNEVVEEVEKDAVEQERSSSYIVNKILEKYYAEEGRLKKGA